MPLDGLSVENGVLIETYWNVNCSDVPESSVFQKVLIETYWNVNFDMAVEDYDKAFVLIETYWNVNKGESQGLFRYGWS